MRERLYRSRDDRMLFGVAGGMAEWLDLDPAIVRLVWALLIVAGGIGFVLYIIAAIVIPEAPPGWSGATAATEGSEGAATAAAAPTGSSEGPATAAPWAATPAAGTAPRARRSSGNGVVLVGIFLVVLGAWFLVQRLLPAIDPGLLWPVVLVALGVILVVGSLRRGGGRDSA